jgi:capsular polysaccharide biosynthesis protein
MEKANTMADCFIKEASVLYQSGTVQVMDKAVLPKSPVKPVPLKNAIIAFALGIIVSLGIVFLKVYLDTSIKNEKDVEKYINLPIIGVIPHYDK